jgi:ubiquinone/menaquinone biosynthesis C-methylase UbiE
MSNQHSAFVGSIPENYDRYLGPLLFESYALDIVERLSVAEDASVLEIASGTGIVTRHLRNRLPKSAKLVATDLNEAMLAYAANKFQPDEAIEWRLADATSLPFPDSSFGAVVCQFGLMFFPDKPAAMREVFRVLAPGGLFVFSVWGAIEKNELPRIARDTILSLFEDDPPTFYDVPFGLHEQDLIQRLMDNAGFNDVQMSVLAQTCVSPCALDAAKGFVEGSPVIIEITQRGRSDISEIESAIAAAIASRCGDNPVRSTLQAIVCEARR